MYFHRSLLVILLFYVCLASIVCILCARYLWYVASLQYITSIQDNTHPSDRKLLRQWSVGLLVKGYPIAYLRELSLVTLSPLERRDIQVQTGRYTGPRVTNSRFQFLGTREEYLFLT